MNKQKDVAIFNFVVVVVVFIVGIVVGTGWIKNIIKLSECDFGSPYKAEIIYGVGMIPVIGMVTGWLDINDGNNVEEKK
jgi:hypothetical protein